MLQKQQSQDLTASIPKLTIELVPKPCWGINLRNKIPQDKWFALKQEARRTADYRCEICGATPNYVRGEKLECHEKWLYDDERKIQLLDGLYALCHACHEVKHMGFPTNNSKVYMSFLVNGELLHGK